MRLIAALAFTLIAATASADTDKMPMPAPLPDSEFVALDLYVQPDSAFSIWDAQKLVPISATRALRFVYRKFDGLMTVVMEDTNGNVIAQSWKAWLIGVNLDKFDAAIVTNCPDTSDGSAPCESKVLLSAQASNGRLVRRSFQWALRGR